MADLCGTGGEPGDGCVQFFRAVFTPEAQTAKHLAARLGVLPSTLMSRFLGAGLPSPKRYVALARLTWAAHLGESPALSISAIARSGSTPPARRATKRNPKAPDFKSRDRSCDGVLWPGQHKAAELIIAPPQQQDGAGQGREQPAVNANGADRTTARASLRACYLDVTDFVLREVRPKYEEAGVPCTDATTAAIAATLFIQTCRTEGI